MKVINGGLEAIEFGYNQNSKNKKEGGYYKILKGQIMDVPEGAAGEIMHPTCGPNLRGLVIIDYGRPQKECLLEGLERYVEFCSKRWENEEQRAIEEEQVGKKRVGRNHRLVEFEKRFKDAEKALQDFQSGVDIYDHSSTDGKQGSSELRGQNNWNESEIQSSIN